MIIDSHCHLLYNNNSAEVDEILNRANKVGVNKILNIATEKDEFNSLINISKKYKNIFFTLGIHPHNANQTDDMVIELIKDNISNKKLLGIGETGLDF